MVVVAVAVAVAVAMAVAGGDGGGGGGGGGGNGSNNDGNDDDNHVTYGIRSIKAICQPCFLVLCVWQLEYHIYLLGKREVMYLVALVCLFVSEQHCSKTYERIAMKFYGEVPGCARKNCLN